MIMKKDSKISHLNSTGRAEGRGSGGIFCSDDQPDLPGIAPASKLCQRCGASFSAARRRGRPEMFCSPKCRDASAVEMRADWARHNPRGDNCDRRQSIECRGCGENFSASPSAGRLPHFCSPTCRRKVIVENGAERSRRRRKAGFPSERSTK